MFDSVSPPPLKTFRNHNSKIKNSKEIRFRLFQERKRKNRSILKHVYRSVLMSWERLRLSLRLTSSWKRNAGGRREVLIGQGLDYPALALFILTCKRESLSFSVLLTTEVKSFLETNLRSISDMHSVGGSIAIRYFSKFSGKKIKRALSFIFWPIMLKLHI